MRKAGICTCLVSRSSRSAAIPVPVPKWMSEGDTMRIWFEVAGRDAGKLQGFFSELFDWQIDANNSMNYGMVNLSDDVGGGVGPAPEGSEGHAMFYVAVDDVDASLQKA